MERKPPANAGTLPSEKLLARNNAASLLFQLLGDEKNVSKILIIKHNSEELGRLIKLIAQTAAADEAELQRMAENDPGLNLHSMQLPPGEKAARAAVAKTSEHELLFTSDKEFEFNLLLTQAQAMNYGWHLAEVAADDSSTSAEAQKFTAMSRAMEDLYGQVKVQMRQGK